MPGREGRAFYPLFPTSFAKYFQMLSNIHSARMYAAQALFANELWDREVRKRDKGIGFTSPSSV